LEENFGQICFLNAILTKVVVFGGQNSPIFLPHEIEKIPS
jgi:hypothetical protein